MLRNEYETVRCCTCKTGCSIRKFTIIPGGPVCRGVHVYYNFTLWNESTNSPNYVIRIRYFLALKFSDGCLFSGRVLSFLFVSFVDFFYRYCLYFFFYFYYYYYYQFIYLFIYIFIHFTPWMLHPTASPFTACLPLSCEWVRAPMWNPGALAHQLSSWLTNFFYWGQLGIWFPQTVNSYRDSPCCTYWGTHMETELHICYICTICHDPATVYFLVGGQTLIVHNGSG